MKAEELMVGDWVKLCNKKGEWLDYSQVDLNLLNRQAEGIVVFKPIPLTTEILLKNGLESDSFGRIWGVYFEGDEHGRLEITVDDKTSEVWWSYNWDEYRIIKLEYLHQLQQAMRLCGIEKEIKL